MRRITKTATTTATTTTTFTHELAGLVPREQDSCSGSGTRAPGAGLVLRERDS
jgi:hypothetical protein